MLTCSAWSTSQRLTSRRSYCSAFSALLQIKLKKLRNYRAAELGSPLLKRLLFYRVRSFGIKRYTICQLNGSGFVVLSIKVRKVKSHQFLAELRKLSRSYSIVSWCESSDLSNVLVLVRQSLQFVWFFLIRSWLWPNLELISASLWLVRQLS